jgi:hypothetical protein
MAGPNVGRECILAYNSGSFGSPTWTTLTRAVDVNIDGAVTWADISSRFSLWRMEAKAQQGLVVDFGYRRRQGVSDAVFTAIRGYAFGAVTKQELAIADGVIATTGTQYIRGTFQFEWSRGEPLADGCIDNFSAHLTYEEDAGTGREPAWTVV